jgi:hypothetical protein
MTILLFRKSSHSWLRKYFMATAVFTALVLVAWAFLPQNLHEYLIPFVAGVGIRAGVLSRFL